MAVVIPRSDTPVGQASGFAFDTCQIFVPASPMKSLGLALKMFIWSFDFVFSNKAGILISLAPSSQVGSKLVEAGRSEYEIIPRPVDTSSSSGTSSEELGSPLTPIEDTFSSSVDCNNPPEARPIFIPKPNNPNINNIGWASASLKAYRTQAREAVEHYLDHLVPFASQDTVALEKAIKHRNSH
ncbi:hypothetical protein EV361DRAFT_874134 [Lentinula raphanica]|uniref:Uncharacterized protein n=1 Tax=Lentinula raphanica TaxID=153919 RepID=A0AA38P1V5_9AGAR|nr:hypothetical protein F5878DRAFT_644882 [Lentinula raphanica]KAJ3964277.1 hypothetical protein EV361DRAFT_874134 [Lentinula raphanica]